MPPSSTQRAYFLLDSLEFAHGTEMLAMILAGELKKIGWEVSVFTAEYTPSSSTWAEFLHQSSIPIYRPPVRILRRYLLPHRLIVSKLWRRAAHSPPTLVWSPTNDILTCVALHAKPENAVPFFVHDPSEAGPACPHYQPLWFKVCNSVTALSVHGERQRQSAISYYKMERPVDVVRPSTFPPSRVHPLKLTGGRMRFGQFGRLATMKGSLFAVAALADCVNRGGDAELHFHGDGPMKAVTQELAFSLGLRDRVFFHGSYLPSQLDDLVNSIDVSIMPSTYEGFGLVMLELLSRGRAVIASDVGSSREILGDSRAGWVVPRANTTALADAMLYCCTHPEETLARANQGPELWKANYTPEKMAARYLNFWEQNGTPGARRI